MGVERLDKGDLYSRNKGVRGREDGGREDSHRLLRPQAFGTLGHQLPITDGSARTFTETTKKLT